MGWGGHVTRERARCKIQGKDSEKVEWFVGKSLITKAASLRELFFSSIRAEGWMSEHEKTTGPRAKNTV